MGLQADKERVSGQQQRPEHNWSQSAAWRSLWQRLLGPKRKEQPQCRHDVDNDQPMARRKDEA